MKLICVTFWVIFAGFHISFQVNGAKILMPFPAFSKSHHIVGANLLKSLAHRGHEVTMISPYPLKDKISNYRDIALESSKEFEDFKDSLIKESDGTKGVSVLVSLSGGILEFANSTMKNLEVQKLMEEESFDLVIVFMMGSLFTVGFGAHFNCPVIILSPVGALQSIADFMGNPAEIATVPHFISGFDTPMTFWERFQNLIFLGMEKVIFSTYLNFLEKKYYDSNFPSPKYPTFDQMLNNISLLLVNTHFSQSMPVPRVPAIVEVGGIHINEHLQPLPSDLQDFLDKAETGAVYFSLGSNMKSSMLPRELLYQLMDVFGLLDMKIVFKWEIDEKIPFKPANVLPYKWLPQNEILAHKNTKLFIGHGGLGGLTEAKYHGVPTIGIPMFGDQASNMDKAVAEGWALKVNYKDLSDETLLKAIGMMLRDKSYSETAKKLSSLMKDRPMSPFDTAAYWIEYVIRHKGAPHMRYPGLELNFIQRNSLDVFAFLALVCYLVYKVLKCTCKYGCKLVKAVFGKKSEKTNVRIKRE